MKAAESEQYRQRDRRVIWHPYSRLSEITNEEFPVITRGEGPFLYGADGERYFDAISSWWCCNLGHSHPELVNAIIEQARLLQHSILGNMSHPRAIELAEGLNLLARQATDGTDYRVFFASDGASAVEAALKITVQYWYNIGQPDKKRFAALEEGYHGDTLAAVSLGYLDVFHRPFSEIVFPVQRVEAPRCTRCRYGGTLTDCQYQCLRSLEKLLETQGNNIAALILEPIFQGAAGMWVYRPGYLRQAAELCRKHRVLLIVDEIAAGFGRTGRMFAFEHAGIAPDIICLGKGITAGTLPLSATLVREEIFATFADEPVDHTFYHGHTFCGNPIAAAAACAALRVYQTQGLVQLAAETGRWLQQQAAAFLSHHLVADVRGIGMMWAMELRDAGSMSAAQLARRLRRMMWARGVLVRPLGAVVYLMPPFITPRQLLSETLEKLAGCLDEIAGGSGS